MELNILKRLGSLTGSLRSRFNDDDNHLPSNHTVTPSSDIPPNIPGPSHRDDQSSIPVNILKRLGSLSGSLRSRFNDDDTQIPSPSNIPSHQSSIPRNILAFRTITMMLAKLHPKQTPNPLAVDNTFTPDTLSAESLREVRISDALAHLAISEHEVVALATKYDSEDNTPQAGDQIISFLFVKNPDRNDPITDPVVTYPNVISATQPEDMGSQTLLDYIQNLDGSS